MEQTTNDILWVLIAAFLVFTMQAGFLCLESGLTRSKNAINVAIKNLTDFCVAVGMFWLLGFGIMFGTTQSGWFGTEHFLVPVGAGSNPWLVTFFIYQAMFCATAATIVSGAVAERVRFTAYLGITLVIALLIYPFFGHWAWGGTFNGSPGWLARLGFVDFAGATVVHGTGGWVALAAVLLLGPRSGRFPDNGPPSVIPNSNLPMAMLGVLLIFFGWFGFNGGSTLALNDAVPGIIANTLLAAVAGMLAALFLGWWLRQYAEVLYALNGVIAGLVAVTAGAHAYSAPAALVVGALGGVAMVLTSEWLLRLKVDDAVGAIPAHLAAGIWGTLAVALLGQLPLLDTGLSRAAQLGIQLLGIVVCAIWSFGIAWLAFHLINRVHSMRISLAQEQLGLNMAEHGAQTETHQLLSQMQQHEQQGNTAERISVDPFTEIGEIAAGYNRVLDSLEKAESRTQNLVRSLTDGVITWDEDKIVTSATPGACTLLGQAKETLIGQPLNRVLGKDTPDQRERFELRRRTPDGELQVLEVQVSRNDTVISGLLRDVTERFTLERQLQKERDLSQLTLSSIGDAVITVDASGQIDYMNAEAQRLTGWDWRSAKHKTTHQVYQLYDEKTEERIPDPARKVLASGKQEPRTDQYVLKSRDGTSWPVQTTAAPILSQHGFTSGVVLVFHDVTLTRSLTQQLQRQANEDPLTGLPNRRAFEHQLTQLLERDEGNHVLCYLDLDQFKVVNDTCGHLAGDELLRQLTNILGRIVRDSDTLARLGGDEFGILLINCSLDQALEATERLREGVYDYRFCWEEQVFSVGVSIGLVEVGIQATVKRDRTSALSAADAACFAAKEAGRNRVHVYTPKDDELMARQGEMQWFSRLQSALDENRLLLYCQPIAAINDYQSPKHYEILVRLQENDHIISPGAFLPAAERYNLIGQVDRWVVQKTLAWLQQNSTGQLPRGMVSINLSGLSLSDARFREDLYQWVQSAELPPGKLCFEITESAAISQLDSVVDFMTRMRTLHCLFALDDFGSGLSSFGYLKQLPVDFLKIDGRLVRDIVNDPVDRVMVQAINTIGKAIGIKTIAEFVESEAIATQLEAIGVDYVQGWYLGEPKPIVALMVTMEHY